MVRGYLEEHGKKLLKEGEAYYYSLFIVDLTDIRIV